MWQRGTLGENSLWGVLSAEGVESGEKGANTQKRAVDSENLVFFLNLPRMKSSFLNKNDERGRCFGFKWQRLSMIFLLMYFSEINVSLLAVYL